LQVTFFFFLMYRKLWQNYIYSACPDRKGVVGISNRGRGQKFTYSRSTDIIGSCWVTWQTFICFGCSGEIYETNNSLLYWIFLFL